MNEKLKTPTFSGCEARSPHLEIKTPTRPATGGSVLHGENKMSQLLIGFLYIVIGLLHLFGDGRS
jgi:hypothetical protein